VSTYTLIHGAGGDSWYWHLVTPRLQDLGHDVVAVDLPCDDDTAGLAEYAQTVVGASGHVGT
jgi:pimeloyl-ACP methyl ester carboxylesterase